MEGWHELLPNL